VEVVGMDGVGVRIERRGVFGEGGEEAVGGGLAD